jgi:hypothetical protein
LPIAERGDIRPTQQSLSFQKWLRISIRAKASLPPYEPVLERYSIDRDGVKLMNLFRRACSQGTAT